ncbi:MAG: SDR family oxidoreductase [Nitriliruptoraceae bacterium]
MDPNVDATRPAPGPDPNGRLAGRRLLVTGASSGIGQATARAAAEVGARVALLARSQERLRILADQFGAVAVPADVVDPGAARAAVDAAAGALGGLDGLVNAAGVARPGPIATTSPSDWQLMLDVNVRGLLHVTQAALPHLAAAEHADVVNVSSMSGRRVGSPEMAVYAASKAAVHALSEGLRREVADDRVRVSVIAPGFVRTGIFDGQDSEAARRLGRRGEQVGLDPRRVADRIIEVLAAPSDLLHVEVALLSVEQ